jgi:RHS repeat-associated protein
MNSDPTPGDPDRVRELAEKLQAFADDASDALGKVRDLVGDDSMAQFVGQTAEAFKDRFDKVPPNLTKLHTSYDLAAEALARYWPKLEDAQRDADTALEDATDAKSDLDSAQTALATAAASLEDAEDAAEDPDEDAVAAEVRRALTEAESAHSGAESTVASARERLEAAKGLAQQAKEAREEAAEACANDLDEASDAGMQNKKWWQKAVDWVVDNWDTIVDIAKIVVAVLGVIVMIIGGPLAWIVLAAALIVLADTLIDYANGNASLWDVAFAALDCIPGMKGITSAAGMLKLAKSGMRGVKQGVKGLAKSTRRNGRPTEIKVCKTDPIDMATGEMVMDETDVELLAVLPLVIERHHVSSYRDGNWFGPSWASTLDQRLVLDSYGGQFFTADGMILDYPVPLNDPREPVMPVEGPRWGLAWDGVPRGEMTVHQPETGHTLHFTPLSGLPGNVLPLAAVSDLNGNRISFHYDSAGAPSEVTHSGGYRIGISTFDGRVTHLRLLSAPDEPALISYDYDADGNLAKIYNSSGSPRELFYDANRMITGWQDRNGAWYRYTYDEDGRCVATDGTDGKLSSRIEYDTENHRTVFTDSSGNTTVFQFNDCYQLLAETAPDGGTTAYTYDRFDRLLTITDPMGRVTGYKYDKHGNITKITRPDGSEYQAEYGPMGQPTAIIEPDGARWLQEYDHAGNQISVTNPLGAVKTYDFDHHGGLRRVTDEAGQITEITCDPAGLPLVARAADGAETRYRRDGYGRPVEVTNPLQGASHMTWGPESDLLSVVNPAGGTESWEWDPEGNNTRRTDQAGSVTEFEYGPFGLVRRRVEPDGAAYLFDYDDELNLVRVTNPRGATWDYRRDAAGRITGESDFDGREISHERNAAGELTSTTNALGQRITYRRDQLGQVVAKTVDGVTTEFTRDPCGRLIHAVNGDTELTLERDQLGQIVAEICNGNELRTAYDVLGRPVHRRTPWGTAGSWDYEPGGRQRRLSTAGRTMKFEFSPHDRETARFCNDELVQTQSWDAADRLARQTFPGAELARDFTYRPDHLLTRVDDGHTGRTDYSLDPAGRVTTVTQGEQAEEYRYDASGGQSFASWSGEPGSDAAILGERRYLGSHVTAAGRARYEYDAAGRVVVRRSTTLSGTKESVRYIWDAQDQLTSVILPDGMRWTYSYDPLGRRRAKVRESADGTLLERTVFTWDGSRLAEQATQRPDSPEVSVITWEYDHEFNVPVTQVEKTVRAGQTPAEHGVRFCSVVTDFVGTPTQLLSAEGEVVWRRRSTLWGVPAGADADTAGCPLGFPGQYYDEESGLHYNHFRYYSPETARYLSPDPLGITAAPDHYSYVVNPFLWVDPFGLECTVVRHFTNRASYQNIMSGGGKGKILLKASSPGKGHPHGVYVTNKSVTDILKKPGGFKSYLGITREKSEYMIEFKVDGDLLKGIRGQRSEHVKYIPGDITVPHDNISYHGPTSGWSAS